MKPAGHHLFLVVVVAALLPGCDGKGPANNPSENAANAEAEIAAQLARLGRDDRRLAEEQKYCPLMADVRLGEMGTPHKIVVKGEAVFVCCENCVRHARDNPDQASAQIKEFKESRSKHPE